MCRRRRARSGATPVATCVLIAALGVGLSALPGTPLSPDRAAAQETLDTQEARLAEQLEATLAARDALPARGRRNRMGAVPTPMDTFMVDGLRVIAPVEDVAMVQSWARRTVEAFERRLGRFGASPGTAGPGAAGPLTIHADWRPVTTGYSARPDHIRLPGLTAGDTRTALEGAVSHVLTDGLPAPVREWLSGPLGTEAPAYRELAAHPSPVVRACRTGSIVACAVALGLAPLEEAPAAVRPDPDALGEADLAPQPLGDGRFAILSPRARRSFAHHLLRTHDGALDRLLAMASTGVTARATADALLERAVGSSLDPAMAAWRATVLEDPPAVIPASVAGTTLLWVLLLLGIATRSTRWRVG